jgi:hypothetical protein
MSEGCLTIFPEARQKGIDILNEKQNKCVTINEITASTIDQGASHNRVTLISGSSTISNCGSFYDTLNSKTITENDSIYPQNSNIFNGVSPLAVRNHQFISAIAMKLHRFAVFPVPYLALRILVGEFAHYLCSSQHVVPTNTLASRFSFNYPEINMALAQLLDNKSG